MLRVGARTGLGTHTRALAASRRLTSARRVRLLLIAAAEPRRAPPGARSTRQAVGLPARPTAPRATACRLPLPTAPCPRLLYSSSSTMHSLYYKRRECSGFRIKTLHYMQGKTTLEIVSPMTSVGTYIYLTVTQSGQKIIM